MTGIAELAQLLTEALALADTLGLSLAAIHIDEALTHIAKLGPVPSDPLITSTS